MSFLIINRQSRVFAKSFQRGKNLIRFLANKPTRGNIHNFTKLSLLVKTEIKVRINSILL